MLNLQPISRQVGIFGKIDMTNYLTPEGLAKFKRELYSLESVERKEIAKMLKHAASFGDLSENAAYKEAKEAQAFLEGRILKIRKIIANARIIEKKETGRVEIGSTVILSLDNGKETFQIVDPEEVDILKGKISYQSLLGKSLLGKIKNDKVIIEAPDGKIEYEIFEIK